MTLIRLEMAILGTSSGQCSTYSLKYLLIAVITAASAVAAAITAWGALAGHGCCFATQDLSLGQAASCSDRRQEGHSCPTGKDSAWQQRWLHFQHLPAIGTLGH